MLTQNNFEVGSDDRNEEQSDTFWTTRQKKFIGLSIFIFWLIIASGIVCYIKFYEEEIRNTEFDSQHLDSDEVCKNLIKEELAKCIERVQIVNSLKDLEAKVKSLQKYKFLNRVPTVYTVYNIPSLFIDRSGSLLGTKPTF